MTITSVKVFDTMTAESAGQVASVGQTQVPAEAARYLNRVWDTQKAGSDKSHYWVTEEAPDVNGLSYDGPGTWGVHTSGHCALQTKNEGDADPEFTVEPTLWAPPATPHASDDEFDQGTLDSNWYNYSVDAADYGTISENTVDAYDTTFNSGNALRVTVNPDERRSWALLQPPATRAMILGKTTSLLTNMLMVSRMKFNQYYSAHVANDSDIALMLFQDSSSKPDLNNRIILHLNIGGTGLVRGSFNKVDSGSPSTVKYTTDVDAQGQALEYVAIQKIGTTYHGYIGTAGGNWIWVGSETLSGTIAHIGFYVNTESTDKPGVAVFGVDFLRFYATDNFLF